MASTNTIYNCAIVPEYSNYTTIDGIEVVSTMLEGGTPRYRRDILNSASEVTVEWWLDQVGYDYIRAFYRTATVSGSVPFTIQLYLGKSHLTTHTAYFKPGSMTLASVEAGPYFTVDATLMVKPSIPNVTDEIALITMVNAMGVNFAYYEDILNTIVNIELPITMAPQYTGYITPGYFVDGYIT